MKIVKIAGVIVLGVIVIGLVILMLFKSTVHPRNIFISDVSISDNKIILNGHFIEFAVKYKGYKVDYKNGALCIKIKGGLISFSNTNKVNLSLTNEYGEIKEVYLQDDIPSGNRLIYPKK